MRGGDVHLIPDDGRKIHIVLATVRPILGIAWTFDIPDGHLAHPVTQTLAESKANAEAWLRDAKGRVGA